VRIGGSLLCDKVAKKRDLAARLLAHRGQPGDLPRKMILLSNRVVEHRGEVGHGGAP
jgi:hypothetical protein